MSSVVEHRSRSGRPGRASGAPALRNGPWAFGAPEHRSGGRPVGRRHGARSAVARRPVGRRHGARSGWGHGARSGWGRRGCGRRPATLGRSPARAARAIPWCPASESRRRTHAAGEAQCLSPIRSSPPTLRPRRAPPVTGHLPRRAPRTRLMTRLDSPRVGLCPAESRTRTQEPEGEARDRGPGSRRPGQAGPGPGLGTGAGGSRAAGRGRGKRGRGPGPETGPRAGWGQAPGAGRARPGHAGRAGACRAWAGRARRGPNDRARAPSTSRGRRTSVTRPRDGRSTLPAPGSRATRASPPR